MKTALLIGAIALLGVSAQAQEGKDKKMEPMDKAWVTVNTLMLNMELGLNETQEARVKAIDEVYVKKHDALEATTPKLSDSEMATKVEELMKARDKDLRSVLNDEQYAKWEKKRQMGTSELNDEQKDKMKK